MASLLAIKPKKLKKIISLLRMKVFWSNHFSGARWVLVLTNLGPKLKKIIALQQILHSNECASLSINFVHLDNKYKNSTNREFVHWATWETTTPQTSWNYLAWCNLLLGLRGRIVFYMLRDTLCGKIETFSVKYLKSQLGLQMNFKRRSLRIFVELRIRKKIEKNLLLLSWISTIA